LGPLRQAFLDQIEKDAMLLQKLNIMDYSLLVGVHEAEEIISPAHKLNPHMPSMIDASSIKKDGTEPARAAEPTGGTVPHDAGPPGSDRLGPLSDTQTSPSSDPVTPSRVIPEIPPPELLSAESYHFITFLSN